MEDSKKTNSFRSYFRDGLLETIIVCQIVGTIVGLVLVLYGFSNWDAIPISIIVINLMGFSVKIFGAVFYKLFYKQFRSVKYIDIILWIPSLITGTVLGSEFGFFLGDFIFINSYPRFFSRNHIYGLIVNFIMSISLFILIALYITLKKNLEKKIIENRKIIELQTKAQLIALQSKINPHFLFNTLNAMINLVYKAPEKVEKMILNLSDIYRKVLQYPENENIYLKDEIILIREYLEIEKIRMGDRLKYKILLGPDIGDCKIPPLIIEPIVENSIIHGISPKPEGGYIEIKIEKKDEKLIIIVSDNGVGLEEQKPKSGFGMISIKERLLLMYKNNAEIKIYNNFEKGVEVKLTLPYEN